MRFNIISKIIFNFQVCAQLSALEKANTLAPLPETTAAINGEAAIGGQLNENKEEATNMLNNHQNKVTFLFNIAINVSVPLF